MSSTLVYEADGISWVLSNLTTFREHGPCDIGNDGNVFFCQILSRGYNRRVGPAKIHRNGYVSYRNQLGELHRTNGPAIIREDGTISYVVNGRPLTPESFFLKYGVL